MNIKGNSGIYQCIIRSAAAVLMIYLFSPGFLYSVQDYVQNDGDSFVSDSNISFMNRGERHYQPLFNTGANSFRFKNFINPAYGNLVHKRQDIYLPDPVFPVKIEFTYNSGSSYSGRFGYGWQMNYNLRYVTNNQNKNVIIVRSDDRTDLFIYNNKSDSYDPSYGVRDSLVRLETGYKLIAWRDSVNNYSDYTVYYFDSPQHHWLTRIEDRNGNSVKFNYDAVHNLANISYPNGRIINFAYSANRLDYIEYGPFRKIEFDYDASGNPVSVKYPSGSVIKYDYDENCQMLTGVTDPEKHRYSFAYDSNLSVSSVFYPDESAEAYSLAYDTTLREARITDFKGLATRYVYDDSSRLSEVSDVYGNKTGFKWDDNYCLKEVKDKKENSYTFEYDSRGNIVLITKQDGGRKEFAWNYDFNKISSVINEKDNRKSFTYDNKGNCLSYSDTTFRIYSYSYDNKGRLKDITGPLSRKTEYIRNSLGYIVSVTYSGTYHYYRAYDEYGNVIREISAAEDTTYRSYDTDNRLVSVLKPGYRLTGFVYSPNGNLVARIDNREDTTTYDYDAMNRLVRYVNPLRHISGFNYDLTGNLLTFTGPMGDKCQYFYDSLYRVINIFDPLGNKSMYSYDKNGNITAVTDRNGNKVIYRYDSMNRLTSAASNSSAGISYSYDLAGYIETITNPNHSEYQYKYNTLNQLISVKDPAGEVIYEYDPYNNIKSKTDKKGRRTLYTYDDYNRVASITDVTGASIFFNYDPNGNIASFRNKANAETRYQYDHSGNLLSIINPALDTFKIEYNKRNDKILLANESGYSTRLDYDKLSRLTKITGPEGGVTSIGYDRNFNITTLKDANNNEFNFFYDQASRLGSLRQPGGNKWAFSYDREGRLISAENPEQEEIKFYYNVSGAPISILEPGGASFNIEYNPCGYVNKMTDGRNFSLSLTLDAMNRIINTNDIDGRTSYNYDNSDNVISFINSSDISTFAKYDSLGRLLSVSDIIGTPFEIRYDKPGRIIGISDGGNHKYSFSYDVLNRLVSVKNPYLDSVAYFYDKNGNLTGKTDESGNISDFYFDRENRLIKSSLPHGFTNINIYDPAGNISRKINSKGDTTKYSYNSLNRLVSVVDPGGIAQRYAYDTKGNISSYEANGSAWHYFYDGMSRLVNTFSPEGSVRSFAWDASGNISAFTDERNNSCRFAYDEFERIKTVTNPMSGVTGFSYNSTGCLAGISDLNSKNRMSLSFNYDERNRLTGITGLSNGNYNIEYSNSGSVLSVINGKGLKRKFFSDDIGRITGLQDSTMSLATMKYDKSGNMTEYRDESGCVHAYSYDSLNRTVRQLNPLNQVTSYYFDSESNLVKKTFQNDSNLYIYDKSGRLIRFRNSLPDSISFKYDGLGKIASLTDENGYTTSFINDRSGRLASRIDPTRDTLNIKRDSSGKMISVFDNNRSATSYIYNRLRPLMSIINPLNSETRLNFDNGSFNHLLSIFDAMEKNTLLFSKNYGFVSSISSDPDNILFEYDNTGNTISSANLGGNKDVVYQSFDIKDRLTAFYVENDAVINTLSASYTFDSSGYCTSVMDSKENKTKYGYDSLHNIVSVTDPQGYKTSITYGGNGLREQVRHSDNSVSIYKYNSAGRVVQSFILSLAKNDTLYRADYDYDHVGNLTSFVEQKTDTSRYFYDRNNRIVKFISPVGDVTDYTYDWSGNRTSATKAGRTVSLAYDNDNRLVAYDNIHFTYDNNGRVISRADSGGVTLFEYNNRNRVTKVSRTSSESVNFDYSGKGFMTKRQSKNTDYFLPRTLVSERYKTFRTDDILEVFNEEGYAVRYYNYLPDSSALPGSRLSVTLYNIGANPLTYFIHTDPFGNPRVLIDKNGNIVHIYKYNAFGELGESLSDTVSDFSFNGMKWDRELNLYIKDGRLYDPLTGRFYSRDPLGKRQGLNEYEFPGCFSPRRLKQKPISRVNPFLFYLLNKNYNYNINDRFIPEHSADIFNQRAIRLLNRQFNGFKNYYTHISQAESADTLEPLIKQFFSKPSFIDRLNNTVLVKMPSVEFFSQIVPEASSPIELLNINHKLREDINRINNIETFNRLNRVASENIPGFYNQLPVDDESTLPFNIAGTGIPGPVLIDMVLNQEESGQNSLQPGDGLAAAGAFAQSQDQVELTYKNLTDIINYRGIRNIGFNGVENSGYDILVIPQRRPDVEFLDSYGGYGYIIDYVKSLKSNKTASTNDNYYINLPGRSAYDQDLFLNTISDEQSTNIPQLPVMENYELIAFPVYSPVLPYSDFSR